KSMPYLLKQHTIAYRFGLKSKSKRSTPVISKIAAYAFFSKAGNNKLPNLPGVLQEIDDLQSIFTKAETNVRSHGNANRENFLSDIEDEYDLLHIGMHATSDLSDYLLNRIYFLSEGNQLDTVYGFEIIPKRVKADMVVLSSCESGYGKFMPGEGTISLARSFQQTGVATVISSLWSLPDYSSPIVCKIMYENIEAGSTPASGLASAKRNYLANANQLTAHPFFWAGLVCY
ncbi:MAG: CHAT domain-containing protein, partial [Cytophagia bacterium]|nr:CHAT domain-containing protein [Cytophagia bacterium]